MTLTAERVRELLHYDPETGVFRWAVDRYAGRYCSVRKAKAGDVAGHVRVSGRRPYIQMCVDGQVAYAHRLAWLYVTGCWPDKAVDHVNGDGLDNRFSNLRLATNAENGWNMRKRPSNTSGYKGATWCKRLRKFRAQIRINGKVTYLGLYETAEAAHEAYQAAAMQHFGQFARFE